MTKRFLSYITVLAVGVCVAHADGARAEAPLDLVLDIESEQTWLAPYWSGQHGPSDSQVRASLERDLQRLRTSESGPEQEEDLDAAETPAPGPTIGDAPFRPKVPTWPYSVSIGAASGGWLAYPEILENSEYFSVREGRNYGTIEMIDAIKQAGVDVHNEHPNSPKLAVGDLSKKAGGPFPPHLSHQSGRDADIGYYLRSGHSERRMKLASRHTIDVPRTWTFISSMVADGKVQYLFVDYNLQRQLYLYAKSVKKVPAETLKKLFSYPRHRKAKVGVIRHLKGHRDHMHVRFHAPISVAAVSEFVKHHGMKSVKPLPVHARIRRGDSLWRIARRHGVTVKKLTRWNRISRRSTLRPGRKLVVGWRRPSLTSPAGS